MIALVRHPPVRAGGRCYGRTDLPLANPADSYKLAAKLPAGRIWSSPSARCRAVAAASGDHTVDDRLRELDFGLWEGLLWDDVPRDALDRWAADPWSFAAPGGESGAELTGRVTSFWNALPAGDHVVISHGGPLKVLAALVTGGPVDLLAPAQALGTIRRVEPPPL